MLMDNFDKHVKEEVHGYLNKHVHFSQEESQQILSKISNKSSTKKFKGVYYVVLASSIVLFTILSIQLYDILNFNSGPKLEYATVAGNENDNKNNMNREGIFRSQIMLSDGEKNNLQLSIIHNPEKYKLGKASLNYRKENNENKDSNSSEEGITLALSFQSHHNSFFTQIFKGEINLEANHKVVENTGNWKLIPDSEKSSGENKYIIAVSEILMNHEVYTIIVQTYDIHDDFYANQYSKTDLLDFIESLKPEIAVKSLLEMTK